LPSQPDSRASGDCRFRDTAGSPFGLTSEQRLVAVRIPLSPLSSAFNAVSVPLELDRATPTVEATARYFGRDLAGCALQDRDDAVCVGPGGTSATLGPGGQAATFGPGGKAATLGPGGKSATLGPGGEAVASGVAASAATASAVTTISLGIFSLNILFRRGRLWLSAARRDRGGTAESLTETRHVDRGPGCVSARAFGLPYVVWANPAAPRKSLTVAGTWRLREKPNEKIQIL
jgi:hypothetical protein